jgi:integrase
MLKENVVSLVRAPKVESRSVSPFSHDKVRTVINAVRGSRLEAPVIFASLRGLRRGELLALKLRYVNLDEGAVFVAESLEHTRAHGVRFKAPKPFRSRAAVPLAPECVELLRPHKTQQEEVQRKAGGCYADRDLVFPNPDGSPWPPDSFSVQFGKLVRAAGCEGFRLHDLRHSFATLMLAGGVSLKEVSGLLRHSSESLTLSTYAYVTVGAGRTAVSNLARSLLGSKVTEAS